MTRPAVFEPIPVIDLMGGQVVRARGGERSLYRPLSGSRLTPGAEPADVVAALLRLHPFRTLYVADLDAIQGRGTHAELVVELERRFPELELWVDAGLSDPNACASFLSVTQARLVIGTESQNDGTLLEALRDEPRTVLSLDSRGDAALDPAGLMGRPDLWPERLILMTLGRVGVAQGPDLEQLRALASAMPAHLIYAAGGVRDGADLDSLAQAGAAGALLASALHDGGIGSDDLARFAQPPRPARRAIEERLVAITVEIGAEQLVELDAMALRTGKLRGALVRDALAERLKREREESDADRQVGPAADEPPPEPLRPERDPFARHSA